MSKWIVHIEYLELDQKLYCLEYDDRMITNITKEQFEDFERLLVKLRTEQPPAGELLPWQQSLLNDYDQRRFLELIERYNHKLTGVWDKDFTINGERLLEIISYGWGATFSLDCSEAIVLIGLRLAEAILVQKEYGIDRSEYILKIAEEFIAKSNKQGECGEKERKLC